MHVVTDLSAWPWPHERSVITIGAYDGMHLGHQAVIAQVRERAASVGAKSVVVTFDRHPASVVRPDAAPRLLTNTAQKLELLAATGVDAVVVLSFTPEQSKEIPSENLNSNSCIFSGGGALGILLRYSFKEIVEFSHFAAKNKAVMRYILGSYSRIEFLMKNLLNRMMAVAYNIYF